jgi:hypothetical protein
MQYLTVSYVQERVEELNSGVPTMDSREDVYRAVLNAVAAGTDNAVELAIEALKAK